MEDIVKGPDWIFGKVDEKFDPVHITGLPKYPYSRKIVDQLVEYPLNSRGTTPVIKLVFDEPKTNDFLKAVRGSAYRYAKDYYKNHEKGWRITARRTLDNMGILFCRIKI